ncbi:MAG: hypothetical protein PHE73_03975 [Sulfurovaceae bacterium]|nr:hypothetical protein [Sulfurovaceae bacterium]
MSLKLISIVIIAGLFLGCASKEEEKLLNDFSQKNIKFQQIQQTQKALYVQDNKVIGFISALYLQPKNNTLTQKQYEKFVLGIYSENEIVPKAMLNGKEAINITKLTNDDKNLEGIPLKTKWNRYYMITFMQDDAKKLVLKVSIGYLDDKELYFSKESGCVKKLETF